MKRTAIWMGLALMVLPLSMASATEPQAVLACTQADRAEPFTPLEKVIVVPSETRPNMMVNICCDVELCCTVISSGCTPCGASGLRWYVSYSCRNPAYTCTLTPDACPTAC